MSAFFEGGLRARNCGVRIGSRPSAGSPRSRSLANRVRAARFASAATAGTVTGRRLNDPAIRCLSACECDATLSADAKLAHPMYSAPRSPRLGVRRALCALTTSLFLVLPVASAEGDLCGDRIGASSRSRLSGHRRVLRRRHRCRWHRGAKNRGKAYERNRRLHAHRDSAGEDCVGSGQRPFAGALDQ